MLSRSEALQIATAEAPAELTVRAGDAVELSNGWYFPWRSRDGQGHVGSHGLIVNKQSGEALHLGSAFPAERDRRAYEAGMTREIFDIRIVRVADIQSTLDFLEAVQPSIVRPEFDGQTTWRIARKLTREELRTCLSRLPHTFEKVMVYFVFEAIEEARANGCCEFMLVDPRQRAGA